MRTAVAVTAAIIATAVSVDSTAQAAGGSSEETSTLETTVSDTQTEEGDEPAPDPADCWWRRSPANEVVASVYNAVEQVVTIVKTVTTFKRYEVTVTYYSEDSTLHRYDETDDRYEYKVTRACREGYEPGEGETPIGTPEWWEATDPDPAMLLTRTEVVRTIVDAPVPAISPLPEAGAPVNLGLWVAMEPAGPYEAFASLGPRVWARRTATLAGIWFDPGNGTAPIWCPGFGTALAESNKNTIEQGPCGYTYTSYDDTVADLTVELTAEWAVSWELSDGTSGTDPDPLTTSTSFPYDVYEIQTVGTD